MGKTLFLVCLLASVLMSEMVEGGSLSRYGRSGADIETRAALSRYGRANLSRYGRANLSRYGKRSSGGGMDEVLPPELAEIVTVASQSLSGTCRYTGIGDLYECNLR